MTTEPQILSSLSPVYAHLLFCRILPLHLSRILYKSATFMQNKPNFRKSQMNVNPYNETNYEIFIPLAGKKTNPIQTQFSKRQNECKLNYNKGLQKKR
jgi:hypothetical protein